MKNLKPIIIVGFIAGIIFSCMDSKVKSSKKTQKTTQSVNNQKLDMEIEDKSYQVKTLETFGSFYVKDDTLTLLVPVSSDEFEIKEVRNISPDSTSINAIIVRVSDGNVASINGQGVQHVIRKVYSIRSLGLDNVNLTRDKKLKVITLNSVDSITIGEINSLKECIKNKPIYDPKSCLEAVRKKNKFILKPNDKKGSIIHGFTS